MGLNDVAFQEEAVPILRELEIRHERRFEGLFMTDAVELAAALCLRALQAGAVMLNLMTLEDVCVHKDRVTGAVVNRTGISGVYHVDPLTFSAKAVLDATGHEAAVVEHLRRRRIDGGPPCGRTADGRTDGCRRWRDFRCGSRRRGLSRALGNRHERQRHSGRSAQWARFSAGCYSPASAWPA